MPSEKDNLLNSPPLSDCDDSHGQEHAPIRVLVVDDYTMLRQALRCVISKWDSMEVVGEASDGLEAIEAVPVVRPHVVVMDIDMPRMNGIEATKRIKANFPEIAVIGLSVQHEGESIQQMRAAGILSYLTKESAVEALRQAIEAAASFHGWSRA